MLRILKDGKAISLKAQEKLCADDRTQNVGPLYVPPKVEPVIAANRFGLRQGKDNKDVKTK